MMRSTLPPGQGLTRKLKLVCITIWATVSLVAHGWYLPGSNPREYQEKELLAVKADKLSSAKTQLPFSFYHLAYCQPAVLQSQAENLGEILKGDMLQNTAFELRMKVDESCKLMCAKKLSQSEIDLFKQAIEDDYLVNLLADNLPGAMVVNPVTFSDIMGGAVPGNAFSNRTTNTSYFASWGVPVGRFDTSQKHILVNHWSFLVRYHETEDQKLSVVGFEVTPSSIRQRKDGEGKYSCDPFDIALMEDFKPDETELVFTYSVKFVSSAQKWATRWDSYLADWAGSDVHWFSIVNALMIVLLLSGIIAMILLRTLLRDIARYNQLDDVEDAQEESGWKLVHGDVFRRPNHAKLLAVCAGTGVQLLGMGVVTLFFALLGFFSPAHRGALLQGVLLLFTMMGWPAGYTSARFNKLFQGDDTTRNLTVTCMTALLFPGVCFSVFFVLNVVLYVEGSSGAVPFGTMFLLLLLWFGISAPLVFVGSVVGYRKPTISLPVRTNQIPRQIPPTHWLLAPLVSHAITGILPFCAVFTELLFILGSVWQHRFYYLFGFVTLVVIILIITCAEISIAFTYFLLCAENYRWWWRAYWASAASAVYVFLYATFYFFARLSITKAASIVLYFGYSALMAYSFFLLTGAIGFITTFLFVRAIYGAVKVD